MISIHSEEDGSDDEVLPKNEPTQHKEIHTFLTSIFDSAQCIDLWESVLCSHGIKEGKMLDKWSQHCEAPHLQLVLEKWQAEAADRGATPAQATLIVGAILRRRRP